MRHTQSEPSVVASQSSGNVGQECGFCMQSRHNGIGVDAPFLRVA